MKRALALVGAAVVLAGCGSSGSSKQQDPPPAYRPNSNQNPGYDGPG